MTTSVKSPLLPTNIELGPMQNESSLRSLAQLVARIYLIYSQIAQNDRCEILEMETKFRLNSLDSASLTRSRGNWSLGTSFLSLTTFAMSLAFANVNDRKFVQLVSEKTPDLFRLIDSRREANIRFDDSQSQLEVTKMQDKNSKSQTEGNVKEQFAQILQAEIKRLRDSAASN